jgi:methylmalonyl-CoA epimerase
MLKGIEHVALAVHDLEEAIVDLESAWGLRVAARERVEDQGVEEAVLPLGGSSLQLIAPLNSGSTVARFLERRGEGLHHIALEVHDLRAALALLKERGVRLIDEEPRQGGRGHLVAFVHPDAGHGVLIELVQRSGSSAS